MFQKAKNWIGNIVFFPFRLSLFLYLPLIIVGAASATGLMIANSNHLKDLRTQIDTLDKAGKDAEVDAKIIELNRFVSTHSNTHLRTSSADIAPIQLVGRYERTIKSLTEKASEQQGSNGLYLEAQSNCTAGGNIPYTVLALCIQQYVSDHTQGSQQTSKLSPPPKELFIYDFAAPTIALDAAGIMAILTAYMIVCLIIRLVFLQFFKRSK